MKGGADFSVIVATESQIQTVADLLGRLGDAPPSASRAVKNLARGDQHKQVLAVAGRLSKAATTWAVVVGGRA